MKHRNWFICLILSLTFIGLTACSGGGSGSSAEQSQAAQSAGSQSAGTASSSSSSAGRVRPDDGEQIGYQMEAPAKGEEVAVLTTSMGKIYLRLFPSAAPKTVENFKGLIQKGYYNGLTFHRVIKDFMIQSGDPNGDGSGGESVWGKPFEDEFNKNLLNLRGAVSMANSGADTNGSQFFINQAGPSTFSGWDYYQQAYAAFQKDPEQFVAQYQYPWVDMSKATKAYENAYLKYGGNPGLDGAYNIIGRGHTVFAQVYKGMDVVDKIASVQTDSSNKPSQSVKVLKAELQKYQG